VDDSGSGLQEKVEQLLALVGSDPATALSSLDASRRAEVGTLLAEIAREDTGPFPLLPGPDRYCRLSATAEAVTDHERAAYFADRAIALDPSSVPARLLKARALIASGSHKKAIGLLDEVLKRDPRSAAAHLMKARSLLAREMPERALESYKEAFAASPSPEALVEAGGCWLALGEQERADKLFAEARSRFASDPSRLASTARALALSARTNLLQPVLKGLLRSFPEEPAIWTEMARLYRDLKEPDRAARCFEKALALGAGAEVRAELEAAGKDMKERLRCPACDGAGACRGCRDGKCVKCRGSKKCGECEGKGSCAACGGSEDCAACGGKGKTGLMKRCEECEGVGACQECEDGLCPACGESGECPGCAGGGKCVECGGSAKCRICKGSGIARPASAP
jgi:tetratricopeptide (TPR) repeat protein